MFLHNWVGYSLVFMGFCSPNFDDLLWSNRLDVDLLGLDLLDEI